MSTTSVRVESKKGGHPLASKEIIDKLRIGKNSFEYVRNLHYNWYIHSVKALLVQMAKEVVPLLDKEGERQFVLCLHRIAVKTDIVRASQCLVAARQRIHYTPSIIIGDSSQPAFIQEMEEEKEQMERRVVQRVTLTTSSSKTANKRYRKKKTQKVSRIYVVEVAEKTMSGKRKERGERERERNRTRERKRMREREREAVLRRHLKFWTPSASTASPPKGAHIRWKRSEYRLTDREGKRPVYSKVREMSRAPPLLTPHKSPLQHISHAIVSAVRGKETTTPQWTNTYNNLLTIQKRIESQSTGPGARLYDLPIDQLVFPNRTWSSRSSRSSSAASLLGGVQVPPIVHTAFSLANSLKAHSPRHSNDHNFKMLSPRFAPIMPDKYSSRGLLSPSILSFYKDEAEDQIASIPSLLEATGMGDRDKDTMLEMIMEVSGARHIADEAFKTLNDLKMFGLEGEVAEVTKRMQQTFSDLERGFSRRQRGDMKRRGYSFLDKEQLRTVYDKHGIKREHHEELDVDEYGRLGHKEREAALWNRIQLIAANRTQDNSRPRRQVSVLAPTVLAPYMFTPVLGLVVLGPVVLSPSLFSPLLLNPAMLSPYVLSPAVGMPFILSPYFLSPYVLSPLVMAPFILNPYVLSPNVLNPYVLSPLILSPLVLCPDVLSPMLLGGAILSPSVASPNVLSKSVLMASVLSPSVLS